MKDQNEITIEEQNNFSELEYRTSSNNMMCLIPDEPQQEISQEEIDQILMIAI